MDQIGSFLASYATKEVLTVFGAIAASYVGYKAAKGSLGMIANVAKKASFMGLASALLVMVGLGTTGLGVGELRTRPSQDIHQNGINNAELMKIASSEKITPESLKMILAYAEQRDRKTTRVIETPKKTQLVTFKIEGDRMIPVSQPVVAEAYDGSDIETVTVDPVREAAATAEESIVPVPIAWSLIGMGIAASLSGFAVFANRHNTRSTSDPHHPNYKC